MKLIEPSVDFEASYCSYLEELGDEIRIPFPLSFPHEPFADLVQMLVDQSQGNFLLEGFVPNSTFWLVEGEEIMGVSNLRHKLTPSLEKVGGHIGFGVRPSARKKGVGTKLLGCTLECAATLGLSRVLLTCDKTNLGSAGVIRANGGKLEDEYKDQETGRTVQRYWIEIDPQ